MKGFLDEIRQRWRLYLPTALFVLFAAAYSAYWLSLSQRLRNEADRWIDQQRRHGYVVSYDELTVGGYPFRLHLQARDVTIRLPAHPAAVTWHSPHVVVLTLPYALDHFLIEWRGPQNITYLDRTYRPEQPARRAVVVATADAARASLVFEGGRLARLALDLQAVKAQRTFPGPRNDPTPSEILAERIQVHTRPLSTAPTSGLRAAAPGMDVFFEAENVVLPAQARPLTIKGPIRSAALNLHLLKTTDLSLDTAGFKHWARNGGVLTIASARLLWDRIDVAANGTLTLDDEDRPQGRVETKVKGHDAIIRELMENGVLDRQTGALINSILSLMAQLGGDEEGRLSVPVKLDGGDILVGPAKVGTLGPVFTESAP